MIYLDDDEKPNIEPLSSKESTDDPGTDFGTVPGMEDDTELVDTDIYSSDELPISDISEEDKENIFKEDPDTQINKAEASEKDGVEDVRSTNEGLFFDRQKVFLIVGILGILLVFFLVFALPAITKNKEKKENNLKQASKTWSTVDDWIEPAKEDPVPIDTTPLNSTEVKIEEESEEIPPLEIEQDETDNLTSSGSRRRRPETNTNEQQKSFYTVKLDDDPNSIRSNYDNVRVRAQNTPQNSSYPANVGGSATAFTPSALNDNIGRYMASLNGDNYERLNNQSGKQKFYEEGGTGGNYSWNSEYTLWKGTIIPAVLETSINTDLPGVVIATVTTNVYSSLNGKHLLIPQGSKLYAQYSSSVSYGQNRVQVIWNTLIRPDGLEVNLGGLNGVDGYGASGYKGFTDTHPFEFLKALGLIACFSLIDTKLNNTIANSSNMYTQNILSDTYSEVKKLDNKIIDKALDVQPTIKIPNGSKVNLITNISMELPPLEPYPVGRKYVRN